MQAGKNGMVARKERRNSTESVEGMVGLVYNIGKYRDAD